MPPRVSLGSQLTVDGVPPGSAHPHGKGFGQKIPLLNVERLRPKIEPKSGVDPLPLFRGWRPHC